MARTIKDLGIFDQVSKGVIGKAVEKKKREVERGKKGKNKSNKSVAMIVPSILSLWQNFNTFSQELCSMRTNYVILSKCMKSTELIFYSIAIVSLWHNSGECLQIFLVWCIEQSFK